ncbi:non-ribosomal peptide synthetase [Streptomyces tagetis]|uniref:Amino acid adenylation domain-containing protein n=1 Tax=Streptomyces tagetis TaxID=2820809 RepID=A0A940XEY9_9ACTN|nr:non-ribosomal peptide synthetase [Streptomyces sp. RG38]MBQ0825396.1 amino acid adenylation domain-containing protein [Streptomyces sp. RG38]
MNVDELLLRALRAGVTLSAGRDGLTVRAPDGTSEELRSLLAAHEDELLAAVGGAEAPTAAPLVPAAARGDDGSGPDAFPLSSGQERLWLIEQRLGPSSLHHVHLRLRWRGRLDLGALRTAVGTLTARHQALRTVFPPHDRLPRAVVRPVTDREATDLVRLDLRGPGPAHGRGAGPAHGRGAGPPEEAAAAFLDAQRRTPFDLASGPLTRWGVVSFTADDHVVALTQHHLITDGWSVTLLLSQLVEAYGAAVDGRERPAPPPSPEYADHVRWERARRGEAGLAERVSWWTGHLAGVAPLRLPAEGAAAPRAGDHSGATVPLRVPPEVTAGLERWARRLGTTLYTVLLAAWAVVLHRATGQEDFTVGTVTSGRDRAELRGVAGFFANTVVLRCDLSGGPDVGEVVRRLHAETTEAFNHEVPFGEVVAATGASAADGLTPLFRAAFVFESLPAATYGEAGPVPGVDALETEARVDGSVDGTAKFDLSLVLGRAGDGLDGLVEYASARFGPDLALWLCGRLTALLALIADEPAEDGGPGVPAACCDRPAGHEAFFRAMLADVTEPCAPYGLVGAHGDGTGEAVARADLDAGTAAAVREEARRLGVGAASVFHQSWALVVARLTGAERPVFGTVGDGGGPAAGLSAVLPVRVDAASLSVEEGVLTTHRTLAGLGRHGHVPPALARRCGALPPGTPLFTSVLAYRHGALGSAEQALSGEHAGTFRAGDAGADAGPWLTASVDDLGDRFTLTVRTRVPVDAEQVRELLATAVREVASASARTPHRALRDLDVLPAAQRRRVVEEFNATRRPLPAGALVHELFRETAARTPHAVALVHGARVLTYGRLDALGNRIAHRLRAAGVGPDVRVGVCAGRSPELVAGVLGVLKAGGAYVPLDPSSPVARLAHLLTDSAPAVVLAHGTGTTAVRDATRQAGTEAPVLALDGLLDGAFDDRPATAPAPTGVTERNAAYVIYTSGSTGTPKGVVVEHRNVVALARGNGFLTVTPDDRVAFAANPSFDATTFEVWGALLHGARLVVVDEGDLLDAARFQTVLTSAGVSVMWLTVGLFNRHWKALGEAFRGLRCLIVGGDALDPVPVAGVLREHPPGRLFNGYGPTETTTFAAVHAVEEAGPAGVPIGRPIGNTRVYVLDASGRPAPVGVTGELYVGGAGVSRGYLGRPGQTAARFVPDPFATGADAGGRLYRTGDLGRWRPDGTIEFAGRDDFQVKVRGFRVEPGEIEARLREHPGVGEAAVIARRDPEPGGHSAGESRLVAYYVPAGTAAADATALREHLARVLPGYMVPAAFVELDALPLTPNGKLDRPALPGPGTGDLAVTGYQAPVGPLEETLAKVWAQVLGVDRVGRHDDFFALGGHSLLAVRLVDRLREEGLECDVRAMFETPTVAGLAALVAENAASTGGNPR